ncbi:hypothetical protein [Lactobacillus delbrueckii]|uniref:hypothetical protein n=1 Tax=Lactobacillus delbrueckii TaxID=1584 RepID=UPI000319C397|nr:hypothetical protein [Lactobacillus delbrueckii]MCD5469603.1 hypothetical protein [Lactobacillus delbrueckii subsp. lactis]MCZ0796875.1 hypothetical protein [Lactobacillus delbrueckii subsp. lactis]MDG5848940.1 hypothetical protein [Lactobacillus delbrueckii]MDK8160747.1 hypothetical protein [Lactobacillus delbrueckii]MDK8309105.1 hypothetical protein [Lactobacillus delbrueckii]
MRSNELLHIDKKDMQVKRIWTFAVSNGKRENNRHFLNEDVIDDNTMMALFHGKSKHRFEIWKITRTGNSFKVKEAATTDGDLISNSSQVLIMLPTSAITLLLTITCLRLMPRVTWSTTTTSMPSGK